MKPKTLAALALAAVLLALAAVVVNGRNPGYGSGTGGQLVFPDLARAINDAAKIVVQTGERKFTVERTEKGWAVADKYGYPAKFDAVKQALVGLAQLKTVEAKTAEPSLYPRLEVEDVGQKGAKGELLAVEDAKGSALASLILGKRHFSRGADRAVELYVRKPAEAQSWLAAGTLERSDDLKLWMERDVVSLARDRVREVAITPADDKPFSLEKAAPGGGDFTLEGVPPEDKLKSAYELNSIAGALAALLLDDVLPAKDLKPDAKRLRTLRYKTFDGLVVELALYEADGKTWAKIAASTAPAGAPAAAPAASDAPKPTLLSAEDVKKEADAIDARGKDWVFGLASNDLAILGKKFGDLVEPKDKAKPKS